MRRGGASRAPHGRRVLRKFTRRRLARRDSVRPHATDPCEAAVTNEVALPALDAAAAHRVLARAAYGARPGEAAALARQGLGAWIEAQLALPADDAALLARLDAFRLPIR